ncbi:hypothetical protein [Hufsiella ginkgonis]|uniref:Uncharacterized protein n=1 Tax=Hufsiella ginkgonis TaxID=2695274 RepID=A0A7K1XYA9_9SPHI|nr:hypothetical protein [Hufsiella ginkgonis]MXV15981.1 hypothetical protein [Hufsiella ginkgonis]
MKSLLVYDIPGNFDRFDVQPFQVYCMVPGPGRRLIRAACQMSKIQAGEYVQYWLTPGLHFNKEMAGSDQ